VREMAGSLNTNSGGEDVSTGKVKCFKAKKRFGFIIPDVER
jgi:hypothetical protein